MDNGTSAYTLSKGVYQMKKEDKESVEHLIEMRKDNNRWLSGEELAKEAEKSFKENKEKFRELLDEKTH